MERSPQTSSTTSRSHQPINNSYTRSATTNVQLYVFQLDSALLFVPLTFNFNHRTLPSIYTVIAWQLGNSEWITWVLGKFCMQNLLWKFHLSLFLVLHVLNAVRPPIALTTVLFLFSDSCKHCQIPPNLSGYHDVRERPPPLLLSGTVSRLILADSKNLTDYLQFTKLPVL